MGVSGDDFRYRGSSYNYADDGENENGGGRSQQGGGGGGSSKRPSQLGSIDDFDDGRRGVVGDVLGTAKEIWGRVKNEAPYADNHTGGPER